MRTEIVVALIGGGFAVLSSAVGIVIEILRRLWRQNERDHGEVIEEVKLISVTQRETIADLRDVKADIRDVKDDVRCLTEDHRDLRSRLTEHVNETA